MSGNRKRFRQQIGRIRLRGNVLKLNCAFHLLVVNMMIFHINMFRLLPYNSRGDQFDGSLVVTSDRYRPINYLQGDTSSLPPLTLVLWFILPKFVVL